MVNNTVNKKGISEGAAGKKDKVVTDAVVWQNNRAQKLEIEVTGSKEVENLPFMIENGDLINDNGQDVVISAKKDLNILKEFERRRKRADRGEIRD